MLFGQLDSVVGVSNIVRERFFVFRLLVGSDIARSADHSTIKETAGAVDHRFPDQTPVYRFSVRIAEKVPGQRVRTCRKTRTGSNILRHPKFKERSVKSCMTERFKDGSRGEDMPSAFKRHRRGQCGTSRIDGGRVWVSGWRFLPFVKEIMSSRS